MEMLREYTDREETTKLQNIDKLLRETEANKFGLKSDVLVRR